MKRRVTMKDVAAEAGVTAATVCRALNSNPDISVATRTHIRKIAAAMGYRPDPLISAFASRLRTKSDQSDVTTIAYVSSFPTADEWRTHTFYNGLFEGSCNRASQLGYKVEHFWLREPGMNGKRFSRILYNRGISLVFIAPLPQARGHLSLEWGHFSCVTVGYSLLRPNLHRATVHHFHSVLLALRELRRLGYRRIGVCLFKDTGRRVDGLWFSGVLFCQKSLPDIKLSYFLFDDSTVKRIPSWCRREKLEVVLGGGDKSLTEELHRTNITQEMDFATLSRLAGEDVAGIDQRPAEVAAVAVDLLIAQLQRGERGIPSSPLTAMVEGRWVKTASVKKH